MRVLLYAPVDLNLIDGSAVWCVSLAQVLCRAEDVEVDVLLHRPLTDDVRVAGLAAERRVRLLEPWGGAPPRGRSAGRLTPEQACGRIRQLDASEPYDLLIVRGGAVCRLVAREPRLAARSWFYLTQRDADAETVEALAHNNGRIACQTPLLQEYFETLLGTGRYVPLPPMVPELLASAPRTARRGRKLCYIGKFEPDYLVEEMISAFAELRGRFADAEFVIAGDKFHDPEFSGRFERRLRALLSNTPGLTWHGGMSRDAVGALLKDCDLGSCWRSARYDSSLELSTKVLEYAAAGLPVLLNPSRINRQLLGDEYPLFVDSAESFRDAVARAFSDDSVYRRAAEIAFETARRFTFEAVSRHLAPWLEGYRPRATAVRALDRPRRIVFAGHDLKFCEPLIAHFRQRNDCLVRVDHWRGHTQHDEPQSEELLRWADVIWCEWCLGNAVWYSARVRPDQRLLIRFHRQELDTTHPELVTWSNVAHLVFIAPHVQREACARIGTGRLRDSRLIYNVIDAGRFARPKPREAGRRLGMLSYCPKLKNPRLAVEILLRLLEHDGRWTLVLAGRPPESYPWLWARPEQRAYYERFERFIAEQRLGPRLIRQGWTDEPEQWYASVGYILSCSDLEGSHQAVAEGMAAGCVPVVRRWPGAAEMYPNSLLFDTADEAARLILENADPECRSRLGAAAQHEACQRFDRQVILPQLEELLLGAAERAVAPVGAAAGC